MDEKKLVCPDCGHTLMSFTGNSSIIGFGDIKIRCINCIKMKKYSVEIKWNIGFEQMIEFSSDSDRQEFLDDRDDDISSFEILD